MVRRRRGEVAKPESQHGSPFKGDGLAQPNSVLNRSFSVIRRRFVILWSATAWPYTVIAICYLTFAFVYRAHFDPGEKVDPVTLWHSIGVFAKLGVLLGYLVSISLPQGLATAGATAVVWADLQGEGVDLRSVFSRISQVFWRLVVLSLCIGSMSFLFAILPGVLLFAFVSLAVPVLVVEDAKVSTALRRGISLASTRLGALLGLYAVVLLVIVVAAVGRVYVASTVNYPWWVGMTIFWVTFVALAPILMMGTTAVVVHIYRDVCDERGELAATEPR